MRISDWSSDVCSSDLTDPRPATRLVALAVVNAIIVARAVRAIALVLLAPSAPQLRLPHLSDESAHYCYIWISRLTAVTVYGYFLAQAALLLGLPPSAFELLLRAIGLFVAGMLVRSEEHTSELQSLMRISYAFFCLKKTTR